VTGRRRTGAALVLVALLALAAGYGSWHSTFGQQLEYNTIAARFSLRGHERPSSRVIVVGIDPTTVAQLGRPPLPRRYDAQMIDRLRRAGAAVIAYDLIFDGPSPSAAQDEELLRAANAAGGRLVLAAQAVNAAGRTSVLGDRSTATIGAALFAPDSDGVIRRVAERASGLPTFAVAAARRAGVPAKRIAAMFAGGPVWVDFPGPANTLRQLSFAAVLDGRVPAAQLRGKIVVVGETIAGGQDLHAVGYPGSGLMSGPELEADAIATLLEGAPLRSESSVLAWLLLILASVGLPLLAWLRRPWPWIAVTGVTSGIAYVAASVLAFDAGTVLLTIPTLASLIVSGVGAVVVPLTVERRELRGLRERFARFDPAVVDAVLADPSVALRLRALALGPESVIAGYRLRRLAGRGGMGVVYEAVQLSLERPVALKLIDPAHADDSELRARFIRESRVAASLAHPHVIPVYEAGEDAGLLYIAMRLVNGGSLHDLIATRAPLAPVVAASVVSQVASALDAAHARGLVHRDVKPANVLLEQRREGEAQHCYLSDFGVTREVRSAGLTVAGERIGSVDYMAPEQCRGEAVGPPADIYSLGCILFEALTGSVPFPRASEAERIDAHLHEPPPRPSERWPGVPAPFDAVVLRALAKDPRERFPTGLELERAVLVAAGIEAVGVVARASVSVSAATVIAPPAE